MPTKAKVIVFLSLFGAAVVIGMAIRKTWLNLVVGKPPRKPGQESSVTFNKQIAPILFEHCAGCHRPGQSAPFSLLEYAQVKKRADQIVKATQSRSMPPWLPEIGHARFANERRLTPENLDLIRRWAEQGGPEGSPQDRPPLPDLKEAWQLGQPDLVLNLPKPHRLHRESKEAFQSFVIPSPVTITRYVRAVEIQPSNPTIVRQVSLQIASSATARDSDSPSAGLVISASAIDRAEFPDGHIVNWSPGNVPFKGIPGMGWRLDSGTDLVLRLHLRPSGKEEEVQVSIGLYFLAEPPTLRPHLLKLGRGSIEIRASQKDQATEQSYELPVEVDALSIYPQANHLCKEMTVKARLPDGREKWLLEIKSWDLDWQEEYRYAQPINLPKGSAITLRSTYGNPASMNKGSNRARQQVGYAALPTNEAAGLLIQVLPANPDELETLRKHASAWAEREAAKATPQGDARGGNH